MTTYAQTDNGTAEYDKGKEAARVQNYTETMNWYRKAADKGNPEAMYALGQIYNDKNFMEDGFVVAYFWLNQGLRLYHENSITLLHEIYTQHKAVISLTFGSNINDMGYMAEVIGHEYRNETDEDIALRWFKRSADYGSANGATMAELILYSPKKVKKDLPLAKQYFEKAKKLGDITAELMLNEIENELKK
ncbi:tetratricopeptide repeat protein [Sphingobacterium lumbrici]|uniref:tetratricopeptide repeat protein n=1 Tax=Sphingobacterium lumbrici TaxID=2559600 RepID=UPI00112B0AE1|nr:tetratricopeptide repeat protein [Sphingobacterium lumbrici]